MRRFFRYMNIQKFAQDILFWGILLAALIAMAVVGYYWVMPLFGVEEDSYTLDVALNIVVILVTAIVIDRRFDRIHENDQLEQLLRLMGSRLNNSPMSHLRARMLSEPRTSRTGAIIEMLDDQRRSLLRRQLAQG
jgi:hypothetical protein